MISNVHYIELFINKQPIELESQDSLGLRINNVLFNPTKTTTTQAEYSYSFDIPSTPHNDKVLNYANNLSKTNKFHARYPSQVYADGHLIFDGSLTIQKYKGKEKMYECNLVNIKINTLDEIFGDAVLTDVPWMIDYDGARTINEANENPNSKYWFPLVSYGAFIKDPYIVDTYGVQDEYTSKYLVDETNRWYLSSFYPSLNVLEELKKCFEWKGYNVGGTAFHDPYISNIYASTNLADEQQPDYNVGNPKFGKISMNIKWTGSTSLGGSGNEHWFSQGLKFPYFPIGGNYYDLSNSILGAQYVEPSWNYTEIFINPLLKDGTLTINDTSTMMIPDRRIIVIPADGFYKIHLSASTQLTQSTNMSATQYVRNWDDHITGMSSTVSEEVISFPPDLAISTPLEIQLIKNYDENIELIKGKNNIQIYDGHPDHETQCNQGRMSNYFNYQSCFPHEAAGTSLLYTNCTKADGISDWQTRRSDANIGYMYANGTMHCFDPVVSEGFICGFTTMGSKNGLGCTSFIKNGHSWSSTYSERTDSLYYQRGYQKVWFDSAWTIHYDSSTKNANKLDNALEINHIQSSSGCSASSCGMVYLKKNDILEVMAIRRGYYENGTPVTYGVTADINLTIEAASPNNIYELQASNYEWYSPNQFPTQLNLMNFTNKETKISTWISNIVSAFNLSLEMNGNVIDVNTNQGIKKNINYAVTIDDRVNSADVESEFISYPREMSVKYRVDTEEHGFYASVPLEHINDDDWKEWGDSGYTVIQLSDDTYETSSQNTQTDFSYTWYSNFTIKNSYTSMSFAIPVISKEEYMIDGYDYVEAMEHRGYNLPQRFWFRTNQILGYPNPSYAGLTTVSMKDDWYYENGNFYYLGVNLYVPINQKDGLNLSYKDNETSLVTEYFNIHPMLASNYVNVDVYLNPQEYINIKNGSLVNFDSDLYYTSEISGYDPSGNNPTALKLIKKV